MPLELRQITSAREVPDFMACYLESFAQPDSPFTHLAAPNYGRDPKTQNDRVLDFSARQWFAHSLDPTSHWFKVVDTELGHKVVAGARWHVYLEDPFEAGEPAKSSAFWWPPGPSQRYTEAVFNNLNKIRVRRQPHLLCNYTFTHPAHRRRGAGTLLMEWATQKADDNGLEIFIEGSPMGSALYVKHGLRILGVVDINPRWGSEEQEVDEEWRKWRELTKNLRCAVLKRPVRGKWESGEASEGVTAKGDLTTNVWEV